MAEFKITKWYGDEILRKVQRASTEAIDEVLAESVRDARSSRWWQSESGRLEANIVQEKAEATPRGARGRFGTTQRGGFYGLFLERRRPFLRPAGDRTFPRLAAAIRKRMD